MIWANSIHDDLSGYDEKLFRNYVQAVASRPFNVTLLFIGRAKQTQRQGIAFRVEVN